MREEEEGYLKGIEVLVSHFQESPFLLSMTVAIIRVPILAPCSVGRLPACLLPSKRAESSRRFAISMPSMRTSLLQQAAEL